MAKKGKKPNKSMYKRFSFKDFFVLLLCICAVGALVYVVKTANENARDEEQHLNEISQELQQSANKFTEDPLKNCVVMNELNQEGWIEFYNFGKKKADISNCYVELDGEKVATIEEGAVLDPGEHYVLTIGKKIRSHGNMVVAAFEPDGRVISKVVLPYLDWQHSYGCVSDASVEQGIINVSKGSANKGLRDVDDDKLVFSVPGGFYNENFELTITAPKGTTVYYTLDGSDPTANSTKYTEPIPVRNPSGSNVVYAVDASLGYVPATISKCMIVRAVAIDEKGGVKEQQTQSYFIGMSNGSEYANLPVLSITTDPENLFNYFGGIYIKGRSYENALARGEDGGASANYLNGWRRSAYVEYFEASKDKTFSGDFKLSIVRDISVTTPQKSFYLESQGNVPSEGSALSEHFNYGSNNLIVQTNLRDNNYKVRDYIGAELMKDLQVGTPDITPCVVFVDGEYWGVYMLKKAYDADYIESTYDIPAEDVVVSAGGYIANNDELRHQFNDLLTLLVEEDMSVPENYEKVAEIMDIQSYLDFFCANMYVANAGYGSDTLYMWRTLESGGDGYYDGKWRFLCPRLDNSMFNGMAGNLCTPSIDTFLEPGVQQDIFFQTLMVNETFKKQLSDTMNNMARNVFKQENVLKVLEELATKFRKPVAASYRRFVSNQDDVFFMDELEKIRYFFEERGKYILYYTNELVEGKVVVFSDEAQLQIFKENDIFGEIDDAGNSSQEEDDETDSVAEESSGESLEN